MSKLLISGKKKSETAGGDGAVIRPQKFVLSSGLEVLLVPLKETQTVTVLTLVRAGSEYEKKEFNGISHFLEHMCFKGTAKMPSSKEISSLMDGLGADFNAFTSQEHTGYYIKVDHRHLDTALDIISDIYLNSLFKEEDIEKEKGVISEEMNLDEDTPTSQIYDVLLKLLYGDQPAGWRVLGEKEIIKKIKRPDFLNYIKNRYTAKQTLVVVSGNFNPAKVLSRLKILFSDINRQPGLAKPRTKEIQTQPRVAIKTKKTDQAHLILGARAFSKFDERRYALEVLSSILGHGMSSRLFQKIREEMGAAYYLSSVADLGSDHGFFGIATGVALAKVNEAIKIINDEFKKIALEPPGEAEMQKAKDYIKGKLTLGLESSDEYAFFHGSQQLYYKRTFSLNDISRRIDAVNSRMIQNLSRELFQPKNINLAILGPFKKKDELNFRKLLK
ncbi:MAG TPA: pitrilysin family protein [Candidatus Paceibacterota bacterium]|nr:pitrilysin family protein [Candidatus Paceibacterota bacterium]